MEMEDINIEDIIPVDYNPRRISDYELKSLTSSIDEFGFVDPIIINLKNNHIIGGHQRYYVLKQNQITDLKMVRLGNVGWVFPDGELSIKSKEHEMALNLALNRISGEWDNQKLNDVLNDLASVGFNVELTGFEKNEWLSSEDTAPDIDLDNVEEDIGEDIVDENIGIQHQEEEGVSFDIVISFSSEEELNEAFEKFSDFGLRCRTIIA